jgi:hypothetical protein
MNLKYLFVAVPAALCIAGNWTANAGQTTNEAGAIVCVNDKWDEKEVGKGHKLVDAVQRCVIVPNDPSGTKFIEDCVGKYEYLPDQSWKGSGTCTDNIGKDKRYDSWEEGSHLKEYTYKLRVAPANGRALVAAAPTFTRTSPTP